MTLRRWAPHAVVLVSCGFGLSRYHMTYGAEAASHHVVALFNATFCRIGSAAFAGHRERLAPKDGQRHQIESRSAGRSSKKRTGNTIRQWRNWIPTVKLK